MNQTAKVPAPAAPVGEAAPRLEVTGLVKHFPVRSRGLGRRTAG